MRSVSDRGEVSRPRSLPASGSHATRQARKHVQIYSCNGTGWSFVAPRANLFDDQGELIITHFAGPTWQAKDGSMVVGHAEASVSVDPTAIPWVRLSAASTTPGQLATTTNIQRIATTGGLAPPAADCNAIRAGTVADVPYTADYYFWK